MRHVSDDNPQETVENAIVKVGVGVRESAVERGEHFILPFFLIVHRARRNRCPSAQRDRFSVYLDRWLLKSSCKHREWRWTMVFTNVHLPLRLSRTCFFSPTLSQSHSSHLPQRSDQRLLGDLRSESRIFAIPSKHQTSSRVSRWRMFFGSSIDDRHRHRLPPIELWTG